jgi:hypothetical protein
MNAIDKVKLAGNAMLGLAIYFVLVAMPLV